MDVQDTEGWQRYVFSESSGKFVAAAKKHRVSRGVELTICPCRDGKNKLLHEDDVVKSHLIRYGFVENYTMWKFHGEADPSVTGASK